MIILPNTYTSLSISLIGYLTGKWALVTMKKKKAVGRSKRVKRGTDQNRSRSDLEKGMATIVTVTNPNTRQIPMKEKGVKRETVQESQEIQR